MSSCSSLTHINFNGLGNASFSAYSHNFLANCSSLKHVDFRPLASAEAFGTNFMAGCVALRSISFIGLGNVAQFQNWFLKGCISLATIDFTAFYRKAPSFVVGECGLLEDCSKVRKVLVPDDAWIKLLKCDARVEIVVIPGEAVGCGPTSTVGADVDWML